MNNNEVRFPVNVVMVRLQCGSCVGGEMKVSPHTNPFTKWGGLGENPLIYHQCDKCGATSNEEKSYPYIEYQAAKQIDHEVH